MEKKVSASVINRLPRYYRYLTDLLSSGIERISSKELSERMHVTASQIRQDLNCFGGFGQQGYGYNVKSLQSEIAKILGLDRGYTAVLVGAGNMGRTFAINTKFESRGFRLIGIFDTDPKKIGTTLTRYTIMDYKNIKEFIDTHHPEMAILAVPKQVIHGVAEELIGYGIRAFLNFSYTELSTAEDVAVENVHLSDSLMRLSYKLLEHDQNEDKKQESEV
ncbi:redox-sensing transcriptional repressor Rex [Ructibacterium gallinarum]|uniref:Redox-sensing transcriptional repressor Rex n=1 Tax=Ructibacterium gallinarum TaxID=2779355 RepID=A0A9D5M3T6_9FIRM|nr:redox-sensing transcriptional repressor Rex [Ructibacterium gallinarum]MBE5040100.1 redox-sensing transcriptional repressor Rex [Ructibacterium gallinarum]